VQPSEVEPDPDFALNTNKRAVESTCSFRVSRNDQSRRRRGESPPRLTESSSHLQSQWLPDRYEAYISNTRTTLMLWHHGVSVFTQNWRQTSTDFVPQSLPTTANQFGYDAPLGPEPVEKKTQRLKGKARKEAKAASATTGSNN
jgi:hypothetical protein